MDEVDGLKRQFLATLSHEFRTPLSGIIGMIDLLGETSLTPEQTDFADTARTCAHDLLAMLNSILEFSVLSDGSAVLAEYEFCLSELLDGACAKFAPAARSKGLELIQHFDENLPATLIGDHERLRQLLSQLIDNAVKFTVSGEVHVSALFSSEAKDGSQLMLTVQDSGIGISADRLDAVFQSFHQLESGLSRRHGGVGLGLALVRKLVTLMHGELTIESAPSMGTIISLTLPMRLPEANEADYFLPTGIASPRFMEPPPSLT